MALTDKQIEELNIAQTRVDTGEGTETDVANIEFGTEQGFTPQESTDVITSEGLEDVPEPEITEPEEVPVVTPEPLPEVEPLELTEPEIEAEELTTRLRGLTEELTGEAALRAEQEGEVGLAELQATQTDLSSQLKALANEAKQIPLQLQQEATGRGITAGGLRPLQTARLRTNAIQALSVNSLLEASRGNIATAQTMVDRAVAQKFDPIREQIAAKSANLELLLQSPRFSLEDKKRAQKQLDQQNARQDALDEREESEREIMATSIQAAQLGADAVVLQNIQNAATPQEALRIATEAGIFRQADAGFTLSEGQVRFDAQGNVIAGMGKPTKPKDFTQTVGDSLLQYNEGTGVWETIYTRPEGDTSDKTTAFKNWELAGGEETGLTFAEWVGKQTPGEQSDYMKQTSDMVIQTVDELLLQVSSDTTGWGAFFKGKLPESEARTFGAQLDTLKGNLGFSALTAMREASKTGGALGQVSDREIKLLTSTLGALDQLQSATQLTGQLNKVRESVNRWNEAVDKHNISGGGDIEDFEWELDN